MIRPFCVCVPARDEAVRLPVLLSALAAQAGVGQVPVALCINNSRDGSLAVASTLAETYRDRLALQVFDRDFAPPFAHVGTARGCAMDAGADLLDDPRSVLISTDADCRPPPGWIAAILAAMADDRIVGGRIVIDEAEPIADEPAAIRRRLDDYWRAVRAIEDDIDPLPWDRPPRHGDHTGASLALTVGLYRAAGGVPPLACGEDRALVDEARIAGGKLVHSDTVWTRVSPRRDGRVPGGMATAMAALEDAAGPKVPAFAHWRRRATWRRTLRDAGHGDGVIAGRERLLAAMPCDLQVPGLPA